MEFLFYPASGLILAVVVFVASQSHSRHFTFYLFWLLGAISFVVSILAFLAATPDQRFGEIVSYHGIFGILGFVAVVVAMLASQNQEREILFSKLMEERQHRASSEITQLAAANSNLLELLNFSLDKIVSMLGLSGGAIHVFHRAKDSLVLGSYIGLSARLARRLETIEFGDTAIGRTAKNKRLLIIRDLKLSQDYEYFGGKQDGFTYMALVPIVSDGENWGVITLFGKGVYQPGSLQVDLLEQFGEQLGAALVLGRRVRNVQSSRDNFSNLVKSLGEELCDTSSPAGGSAKGVAWMVTRLFGGDRYDICTRSATGWKIAMSSEPGFDGRPLRPGADSNFAASGTGIVSWEQPPPFEEFMAGKSYAYASLFGGNEWLFVRLENRRKQTVDLELMTDAFRIVYGLYSRFTAFRAAVAKAQAQPKATAPSGTPSELSDTLGRISGDLEMLITEYSGSRRESDLKELFAWLAAIQRIAGEKAKLAEPPKAVKEPESAPGLTQIIHDAITQVSREQGNGLEIAFESDNGVTVPDLPADVIRGSILEFISAALFDSGAQGKLRLLARGGSNSITFELKGNKLNQALNGGEKPSWLSRINGQVDCFRIEEADGQTQDLLRLTIPIAASELPIQTPAAAKIRVLAVDNQEVIRELLTGMLSGLGYESSVVGTSEEALTVFKVNLEAGRRFTHVIADYGLDRISGLELAGELRMLDPAVRLILISRWGLAPDRQSAARIGIDAMLRKPFRMEQLAEIIESTEKGAAR